MAIPTCPRCEGRSFEMSTAVVGNSQYQQSLLLCSKCGSVLGLTEYLNVGSRVEELRQQMTEVANTLQGIQAQLNGLTR